MPRRSTLFSDKMLLEDFVFCRGLRHVFIRSYLKKLRNHLGIPPPKDPRFRLNKKKQVCGRMHDCGIIGADGGIGCQGEPVDDTFSTR